MLKSGTLFSLQKSLQSRRLPMGFGTTIMGLDQGLADSSAGSWDTVEPLPYRHSPQRFYLMVHEMGPAQSLGEDILMLAHQLCYLLLLGWTQFFIQLDQRMFCGTRGHSGESRDFWCR